jgi:FkbM family methyltransferase
VQLIVESRQLLDVVRVRIGEYDLWIREEPRSRHWDTEVARPILEGDEYELEALRAAGHRLRWVVDVGAHVGSFTLKIKRWWPEARVLAAEPDPDSAALFRRNTEGLEGVAFEEAAVLGRPGIPEARLRQAGRANHDGNAAASSVLEVAHPLGPTQRPATVVVRAASVLDLLERHELPRIDLLKLDCEGAEGEILEALRDAGWMERVGWIRGEWHGRESLPRIEEALRATHTWAIERGDSPWGAFLAHNHLGH